MFCHYGTRTGFVLTNVYVRENWESQWLRSNHSSASIFPFHCTLLCSLAESWMIPISMTISLLKKLVVNMQKQQRCEFPHTFQSYCKLMQVLKAYFHGEIQGVFRIVMWPSCRLLVLKRSAVILDQCF